MDDGARLRALIDGGALLHPLALPGTVDLAHALASLAGPPSPPLTERARTVYDAIGEAEHHVFVLADGLGMHLLEDADAPFLRAHIAMELRAVYPSSTAPALTSLASGTWPAAHGATGWWTYIPAVGKTITLLPYIERFGDVPASELGLDAGEVFPLPAAAASYSTDTASVMPKWIADSIYSRYVAGGRPIIAYSSLARGIDAVIERIGQARGRTYTYVYTPIVDTAEHEYGPLSGAARRALGEVDQQIARLASAVRGRARVVLSADHGQMEAPNAAKVIVTRTDPLLRMLALPPSCEPRAPAFHCLPGRQAEFAAAFRVRFSEQFALLTLDEADEFQLFGPERLAAETRRRLGDFVGVSLDDAVLLYEPHDDLRRMKGFHAGMLPAEMRVPLVVA